MSIFNQLNVYLHMNLNVLKNKSNTNNANNIKTFSEIEEFLEEYLVFIKMFNKHEKNILIELELNISRNNLNRLQIKMFNKLVKIIPEIINHQHQLDFDLYINLDELYEDFWVNTVKRCIVHFNKDASSVLYLHNGSRYIIKKFLYHSNHNLSTIKTLIIKYYKRYDSSTIPLEYIATNLKVSKNNLLKLLHEPLNEYFYVMGDYLYYYRKNCLKDFATAYRRTSRHTSIETLYNEIMHRYSKKLEQNNIHSLSDFRKLSKHNQHEQKISKYDELDIKKLFIDINNLITKNKIKCFNIRYIVKKLNLDETMGKDLGIILEIYQDYYRVSKNLYFHKELKPTSACKSSKKIVLDLLAKKDYTTNQLEKVLLRKGRIMTVLSLNNTISLSKNN